MRSRPLTAAVLATGLVVTACTNASSDAVESVAGPTTTRVDPVDNSTGQSSTDAGGAPDAQATDTTALLINVAETGATPPNADTAESAAGIDDQTTTSKAPDAGSDSSTPSSTAAPTTAKPTQTTAASTTTAATRAAPSTATPTIATATTATPTTATPTTRPPSNAETRPEILRLALPKFGGGEFNPDSVAGKNVILWFWGAH